MNKLGSAAAGEYWDRIFAARPWGSYPSEDLVRFIGRQFRTALDKSRIHVLEIGCGPGPNIWYLIREGFTVAGIDGSPTAIRQTQKRLEAEGLPHAVPVVDLRVGDFAKLPWGDDVFDAVVDIAALYANPIEKITTAIAEIERVLKPGGVFFGKMFGPLTTGSDSGYVLEPRTRKHPTKGPCAGNEVAHFFSREELDALFFEFGNLGVDETNRTDRNGEIQIFEWLVSARK